MSTLPSASEGPELVVANEFAEVRVRLVRTGNGTRLEVRSPRTGASVLLCPLELESLTWQSPQTLSRLLAALHEAAHSPGQEEEGR